MTTDTTTTVQAEVASLVGTYVKGHKHNADRYFRIIKVNAKSEILHPVDLREDGALDEYTAEWVNRKGIAKSTIGGSEVTIDGPITAEEIIAAITARNEAQEAARAEYEAKRIAKAAEYRGKVDAAITMAKAGLAGTTFRWDRIDNERWMLVLTTDAPCYGKPGRWYVTAKVAFETNRWDDGASRASISQSRIHTSDGMGGGSGGNDLHGTDIDADKGYQLTLADVLGHIILSLQS